MSIFKYFFRRESKYQCAGCKEKFLANAVCPSNQGLTDYLYCEKCWPDSQRVESGSQTKSQGNVVDKTTEPQNDVIEFLDFDYDCLCGSVEIVVKKRPVLSNNEMLDSYIAECDACGYIPSDKTFNSVVEAVAGWNNTI